MYYGGVGVAEDKSEAAKWFRKAATQSLAVAENQMGLIYERGQGAPRDYRLALEWFRKAAEHGSVEARRNLAAMYVLLQGDVEGLLSLLMIRPKLPVSVQTRHPHSDPRSENHNAWPSEPLTTLR